jgi:hypothetical protein
MRRALRETDVVGGLQCGGLQQDTVAAIRGRLRA